MPAAAQQTPATSSIIQRVVARNDPPPRQYRALRRLEAQSDKLGGSAWIEAWTEVDPAGGFRYEIIGEGGSGFVRGKVLRPWLASEKKILLDKKHPGRDITGDLPDKKGLIRSRLYAVGDRFYMLLVIGTKDWVEGKDLHFERPIKSMFWTREKPITGRELLDRLVTVRRQ